MQTVLVFGPGFLGTMFAESTPGAILSTADIANETEVREAIEDVRPDVVVNFAGKTGKPNVDWCEENKSITFRSNVTGALILAGVCQDLGLHLIHISSGCIFYGTAPDPRGWLESDFANPVSFYSCTKYAAELVIAQLENTAVIRLRMPIDSKPSTRNLITKLANYPKIIDVENSVTIIDDLMEVVRAVIAQKATGVFHAVNPGSVRHRDIIALYEELVDPNHVNEWINEQDLVSQGLARKARSNNLMQNTRLAEIGINMRPINIALRDAMEKYAAVVKQRD
ncbi:sugar nucleotide-binding protein [Candidatus Uhrbacteria bacterium]|nr:sugar nucleotide-binding protein [Candidatus Uhrbacteria bacterium]